MGGLIDLLGGLAKLFSGIMGMIRDAGLRREGRDLQAAQDAARTAKETTDEITRANAAGDAVERDIRLHPDAVRLPDKYSRD